MQEHPFTARRLFNSKYLTIEKEMTVYYQTSQNIDCVIKLVRALQIRKALRTEEIQHPCHEIVRTIYLKRNQATQEMKKYVYYFCAYFSLAEWKVLILALFPELPVFSAWKIKVLLAGICLGNSYRYTVP